MKTIFRTLFLGWIAILMSCLERVFEPKYTENPWIDDFSNISAMTDYKQFGVKR